MATFLLNGSICTAMTSSWAIILSRVENRVEEVVRNNDKRSSPNYFSIKKRIKGD